MRIAWFAPHNPLTVAAYVTRLLRPFLPSTFDWYSSGETFETKHYLTFLRNHTESPYDAIVYLLGDGREYRFVRMQCGILPGICWFFDYTLTDEGPEPLHQSSWQRFLAFYCGKQSTLPTYSAQGDLTWPHARREGTLALKAFFAHARDAEDWRRHSQADAQTFGARLALAEGALLPVPVRTAVAHSKREPSILLVGPPRVEARTRAIFEAVKGAMPLIWAIPFPEKKQAEEFAAQYPSQAVQIVAYRDLQEVEDLCAQVSAAILLRFSVYGHLTPFIEMAQAAGLPCAVTDFGDADYLPSESVVKISAGGSEVSQLLTFVQAILQQKFTFQCSTYARELHAPESIAGELLAELHHLQPVVADWYKQFATKSVLAREAVLERVATLYSTDPLTSWAGHHHRSVLEELFR